MDKNTEFLVREVSRSLDRAEDREALAVQAEAKGPPPQINRAAIKRHALKVSKETRNGKFDRVSSDFIEKTIADFEADMRRMRHGLQNTPFGPVEVVEDFLTGEGKRKLAEAFNIWLGNMIYRRVNAARVGKTL